MSKTPTPIPTLCLALLLAACGKDEAPKPATPPEGGGKDAMTASEQEHGDRHDLAQLSAFGVKFDLVQYGPVLAGEEAAFELEFESGAERLTTVRGWIGVESGEGSMKELWIMEGETGMHGHVHVPDPIPDGSKLWLEFEKGDTTERRSIAWHQ